jgi:hypothetical protein
VKRLPPDPRAPRRPQRPIYRRALAHLATLERTDRIAVDVAADVIADLLKAAQRRRPA